MGNNKRIILGIDPGSRYTGYGIIWQAGSQTGSIHHGHIDCTKQNSINARLYTIYQKLIEIIQTHQPHVIAIEQIFTCHNPASALKLGQARGAALVATAANDLPVFEYSARQIKQAVVGYGAASKNQVQQMIRMLLKLPATPQSDAADALAVALCHAHSSDIKDAIQKALAKEEEHL